ncbi:uncharacterized protein LOC120359339 [Solenopsis invicta]|uniref:uncharacterized protein LOC120359339 n=1 Tax=Solenopsis invicta TaxID=13686 RepID=UPI00193E79B5|nr:uncharacterized protein LOC120359339 [Solenopsis invicta]
MNKDVSEWARNCLACQRSKTQKQTRKDSRSRRKIRTYPRRFSRTTSTLKRISVLSKIIDRSSRWPEAIPIPVVTADTVATALFNHWITRFGAPSTITTDQGAQFESQVFNALMKLTGCSRIRTTAYHPAANGLIERWHRSLKAAITCHNSTNWVDVLQQCFLDFGSATRKT